MAGPESADSTLPTTKAERMEAIAIYLDFMDGLLTNLDERFGQLRSRYPELAEVGGSMGEMVRSLAGNDMQGDLRAWAAEERLSGRENQECVTSWEDTHYRRLISTDDGKTWFEVTKDTWVIYERRAGFHNTLGKPNEPATAGFSSSRSGIEGKLVERDEYGKSVE